MHRSFKLDADQALDPWALIIHRVAVLDTAAKVAEEQGDIESLVYISDKVGEASRDLVQVYMFLTGEEEDEQIDQPREKLPLGFVHRAAEADEDQCECEEND